MQIEKKKRLQSPAVFYENKETLMSIIKATFTLQFFAGVEFQFFIVKYQLKNANLCYICGQGKTTLLPHINNLKIDSYKHLNGAIKRK